MLREDNVLDSLIKTEISMGEELISFPEILPPCCGKGPRWTGPMYVQVLGCFGAIGLCL